MAGLIQKSMGAPDGAEEKQEQTQGMPQENEAAEGGADENDPAFKGALEYAMKVLYEEQAAKDVSQSLKSAPSVSQGMADVAYDITSIVDEKTQGAVPDELLVLLGMRILEEIAEIADASGLNPSTADVAQSFKTMLLRFLQENGVDTAQLQQAMDQVDPSVFEQGAEQGAV